VGYLQALLIFNQAKITDKIINY